MSGRSWLEERANMGIKLGLENCEGILSRLGNPQSSFPSIHVAGTNGKGSLCAQLSAASSANGLKTGLFTSPHLVTVEERIRIDGVPIEPQQFDQALSKVMVASEENPSISPTYFETTFLVAMVIFRDLGVERAIIETGMGGRMDATILVEADMAILTTISMDHSEYLGDTITEIASEKVAIHRPGNPFFAIKPEELELQRLIEDRVGADLSWAIMPDELSIWESYSVITSKVRDYFGWKKDYFDCIWPGRSPGFGSSWFNEVDLKFSAAHNPESMKNDIRETEDVDVILIAMIEKDEVYETMRVLSEEVSKRLKPPKIIITEIKSGRKPSLPPEILTEIIHSVSPILLTIIPITDLTSALEESFRLAAQEGGRIMVAGSIYLLGEIISKVVSDRGLDLRKVMTIH
jgi:folylpolyglutamate synthase/dihydropteroate synthase